MGTSILLSVIAAIAVPADAQPCRVVGATSEVDVRFAKLACEAAQERLEELFRAETEPIVIVLSGDGADLRAEWILHWHTGDELRDFALRAGLIGSEVESHVVEQWEEFLPHEIGHVFVWQYLENRRARRIAGEYATPLPDWFEEAAAIWMEPEHLRNQRLAMARIFWQSLPSVADIVNGVHPRTHDPDPATITWERETGPCEGSCPDSAIRVTVRQFPDGRTAVDTQYVAAYPWEVDGRDYYYPQVYSLLAYIHDVGGYEAVNTIVRRLRNNPRDPNHLENLPNLPSDLDDLDRAWRAWLQKKR
jgi:hypothetical protein